MKWNEVAKVRMKDLGMTQEKLSEHLGITPGAVSHWLNARRSPELEVIARILHILDIDEFKVDKNGSIFTSEDFNNSSCATKKINCYPLLSKELIINYVDDLGSNEADNFANEWIESGAVILGKGFWYKVEGDAMLSPTGFSVPSGSLVLFDMGRVPQEEDLILVMSKNNSELSFKKIQSDGHRRLLVPMNPRWPVDVITDEHKILAIAVESKLKLK
ncbi:MULTISPECIES: LexA family transcriptional regulator [unclassified Pantoea]|uniref:LexA family protein n=1 Tax=Pantoea TaxID=53335 RepID=UPI0012329D08|nr:MULTISPECIES: LexA family transcriptional regulator [unclassified Pantoea]KAA5974393.1 helix-turn-helix domain-containing protein [Pantoea sp. M_6]KAA5978345.1 helix-turn-helix domain-containing protein [Pantoea sp. M_8]KAA5989900.1 helix-turn-helix domain-containing protein [Pantoea sp. M_10]KAA6002869.1 helix-turn-helix domain-containing protein [Pantoea sp. M_5]